jgi:hypothetical protein
MSALLRRNIWEGDREWGSPRLPRRAPRRPGRAHLHPGRQRAPRVDLEAIESFRMPAVILPSPDADRAFLPPGHQFDAVRT